MCNVEVNVSIIIPFQRVTPYLRETLDEIGSLHGIPFEVILLPDGAVGEEDLGGRRPYPWRIVPTGTVSPAVKRDVGAKASRCRLLAFIDDDAYPAPDWLAKAVPYFEDDSVAAVGGPQLTPPGDGFWEKVSGATFLSPLNGTAVCRYWPCKKRFFVDDWPSVNLIMRKEDFLAVGGFDSTYWPGEDTKLCLDLVEKLEKKIVYEPEALVYHHRRSGFFKHMKQVGNYGLHRGYFAKRLPATSLRLRYFMPSCFFLFVCFGWGLLLAGGVAGTTYRWLWLTYLGAICLSALGIYRKLGDLRIAVATTPYLAATHFWYGWRFLKGLFLTQSLQSRLGR
jgi:cellulose synthase/poly-beta-1,6-N-acetylglucosamine synthase-like glycosyltransferase